MPCRKVGKRERRQDKNRQISTKETNNVRRLDKKSSLRPPYRPPPASSSDLGAAMPEFTRNARR